MWLGIDDTDGPDGGCTTFTLTEIIRVARDAGLDLIGEPRLVRLNPNVPWKTRGNGALAARFGHGRGARRRVGLIDGSAVWCYRRGRTLSRLEQEALFDAAWAVVERTRSHAPRTNPALVASPVRLGERLYGAAVSEIVPVPQVRRSLREAGARHRSAGGSRGLVGAAAAIAWPGRRRTFELLAYRRPAMIGRPRRVNADDVRRSAARHPELFLCYDPRTRRLLVAPHTRCPILFGLRATRASALPAALREVRSEVVDRWVIFTTNQGTGDHRRRRSLAEVGPYESGWISGTVVGSPVSLPGGHVSFRVQDTSAERVCLVFEPTKTLPRIAAALREGDQVSVWGGRGTRPEFRVEGIQVLRLAPRLTRAPPTCPDCRRRTGSLGRGRGYRCPGCRRRFPPESAVRTRLPPEVRRGTYHPTPSARRHIAPRGPEVTRP